MTTTNNTHTKNDNQRKEESFEEVPTKDETECDGENFDEAPPMRKKEVKSTQTKNTTTIFKTSRKRPKKTIDATGSETEELPIKKRAKKDITKKEKLSATIVQSDEDEEKIDTLFPEKDENGKDKKEEASIKQRRSLKNGGKSVSTRKGASTPEEDKMIMEGMAELAGEAEKSRWKALADRMGNGRNADFVRHRWATLVKKIGEGKLAKD
ncbi:8034_t:CDS:2 [Ambispora leptoticha]|uniref:8034_t:CDS:1 n=1 Tax=Ambispora leptoticha TaxID=144679 RepID=A0A9N9G0F3_9GLOM|nr:8034_t:CDS:2 [Ambispora leptoticha]